MLIFLVALIVFTALLSSRYYLFQNIIEDGKSKKDIIATKTIKVIDTEKTERKKSEWADKIKPILTPPQDNRSNDIKADLRDLLDSVKSVRSEKSEYFAQKQKITDFLNEPGESNFVDSSIIVYLFQTSGKNFSKVSYEAQTGLDKVLQNGVSSEDLSVKKQEKSLINQSINNSLSYIQRQVVIALIGKVLYPNRVVDEAATSVAKKNAMKLVNPIIVTYNKGETIVSTGDFVTKLQIDALKRLGYNVSPLNLSGILGILCLVGICIYTMAYYLVNFETKYANPSYLSLMALLAVAVFIFAVSLPMNIPVYIIPIPAFAILLTVFTNSRISLIATVLLVILIGLALQYRIEAIAVFAIGGMVATFTSSLINYYRRMDLVKSGFNVALIQVLIIFSIYLLQGGFIESNISLLSTEMFLGFISGIVSGIIALGTLPLIESAFKIITPYGLAELADHNQTLLKRLQFEAPGTYHHSLMVSNLAEAAAEAIGASPILARVGAFYHDIGKLKRPLFFIENQSYFGIENPHEKLNPRLSKMVVTAHPKDGIELAKEYKLPNIIHQFILQHHGDGLAAYFYKQALETEGAENICKEQFRYTGPKPSSKEAAILMLADAVESAVRAIKNPTPTEIEEIVDKILKERLLDGQLSESPLTQKDIKVISVTFNRILRGMQHHRIKYHENVLEELGQKTSINIQLAQTVKKIEQELSKEASSNAKEDKNE
jgi:putative nucleotidyltransferase with HDIG domain